MVFHPCGREWLGPGTDKTVYGRPERGYDAPHVGRGKARQATFYKTHAKDWHHALQGDPVRSGRHPLDTLEDLATAANRALGTLGLPAHPTDAYRVFVGDGLRTLAERILPGEQRSAAQVDALVAAFEREYSRTWNERTAPYAGVPEMLDRLTGDGYRMSVLSNKPDAFTRLCVEQLLPHWTFAPLYGQRPGVPKKPDPAAALAIAAELGLDPAEVLYLGDTATDMHTARAAGMAAVGVLWGFRSADELRAAGARHLITHPGELAPLLHPSSAPRS